MGRSQLSDVRAQKTDSRGQITEDRRQITEDREGGIQPPALRGHRGLRPGGKSECGLRPGSLWYISLRSGLRLAAGRSCASERSGLGGNAEKLEIGICGQSDKEYRNRWKMKCLAKSMKYEIE